MANYLAVVYRRDLREALDRWLARRGAVAAEHRHIPLAGDTALLIVSKGVERCLGPGEFFRGTAVVSDGDAIAFGLEAWRGMCGAGEPGPEVTGSFVRCTWSGSAVRLSRDYFGNVRMLWTQMSSAVAVSDSLLVLADLRRHLGESVTAGAEALVARAVYSGLAAQQISPDTYVREIAFVPAGQGVAIADDGGPRGAVAGPGLASTLTLPPVDYAAAIRTGAARIAKVLAGVAAQPWGSLRLNLSGGYDSRVVLAAALRGRAMDRFAVYSANRVPSHRVDYEVATRLAEAFGFPLNVQGVREGRRVWLSAGPLAVWASSELAIYDRLVPTTAVLISSDELSLTGMGAEVLKGNWGWRSLDRMVQEARIDDARREALLGQVRRGADAIGADTAWADSGELHYAAFRNGLHGASEVAMSLAQLRPFQQLGLARIAHARAARSSGDVFVGREDATFLAGYPAVADMLILLSPEAAALPFDTPAKGLSRAVIDERLSALGGELQEVEIEPAHVVGQPSLVPHGPSAVALGVARAYGLSGKPDADALLRHGTELLDVLDDPVVRSAYEYNLKHARWRLEARRLAPADAGTSTPKMLSLAALAGPVT
ncbi:hypothetical protein [Cellulomonas sp.]|uniref:hypothetical protein n=1 Tax=Cellulomonas sp. TaxID=40001 RepID=UPI00281101DA|nr:hypothetical protein [Cellulomonas sp.]